MSVVVAKPIGGSSDIVHTGEVTGQEALTVDASAISNKANIEAKSDDEALLLDSADGELKRAPLNSITDGGYF